jgi:uncharacterized protein YidB (DUF937 family)
MGLMDVLRGMSNGPRGQVTPGPQGGGGMSPITMGLLALLAYKTLKGGGLGGLFGQGASQAPGVNPGGMSQGAGDGRGGGSTYGGPGYGGPAYGGGPAAGGSGDGGSLVDWLRNGLGGALAGGAAGSIVSGGISELLRRLQQNGQGDVGHSWIGTGPNQPIAPGDLERAAGADTLDALARESGMSRDELLQRLSMELPQAVDNLTPDGRVPTDEEAARRM